ncbi:MAG: ABC transporter permease [Rhizobiales bacterium]|nr:ABC transporter permease [Hyphomicrobiales bacterium]
MAMTSAVSTRTSVKLAASDRLLMRLSMPYRIVATACGIFLLFVPMLMTFYISLFDQPFITFPPRGYTWRWFTELYADFGHPFMVSLQVALAVVVLSLLIGVPAGIGLSRYEFRGKGTISMLLLSPLTIPSIAISLSILTAAIAIQQRTGVVLTGSYSILVVGHVLIATPWVVRLCLVSLANHNRAVEEAAASLGATPLVVILRVTIPAMRQGMIAAALFAFIISFESLEMSLFLVSPGISTLPVATLNYLEVKVDPLIAALSVVQIIFVAAVLLVLDRFVRLGRNIVH